VSDNFEGKNDINVDVTSQNTVMNDGEILPVALEM